MKPTSSHAAFEDDFKAFLDGELSLWRQFQVRRHLQACPHCREELSIMQLIENELKTEENALLGEDLRAKILDLAPVEAPKVAPRKPVRVTPKLVFGMGSLAVLCAIVFLPTFGRSRENALNSNDAMEMSPQFAAKKQADQSFAESPRALSQAKALSREERADNFASRRRVGDSFKRDEASSALNGIGNQMYFDDVVPAQRQIHKQGSLTVTVTDADAEASGESVEILVKNVGGFVAQNALSTGSDGRKTATLDVRVPVAQFETIVSKIGKLGSVSQKSVNGEDITQRVTQAGAQKQSLARELAIREAQLRQADPKKADARRNIVADVRQLRFQANQARAQLEYLQKHAALATLFVTLQDKAKPVPVAGPTSELRATARNAWSSFLTSAQWPLQLLIWIAAYSPLWVPALILWRKFGHKMLSAG